MATKNITMGLSPNQGSSSVPSTATLTGRTVYGRVVSASTEVIQSAPAVNPSIQWVNSTMSAPAYRSGNWEGENPEISPAFTYNDITAITVSVVTGNSYVQSTYLSTGSTNTVDVELKLNKNTSLTPQIVVRLTGIGRDGLTYTDDLLITQDAGVDPHIDIDGQRGGTAYTFSADYTGSTGGYFGLSWAYVRGSDIEIGRNGNVISVTIGQSGASGYEFDIAMLSNTAQTQAVSTVSFTGTTVYGDDIVATLTITQNGVVVPTTSFTWNYQVHFAGLPQAGRLFIHFDLRDSSNNLLAYAELDDDSSSYDDSIANQWFSGTTTVTVPTTVNLNNLNVENNPTFTGSYYSKNLSGNVFTSTLTVPSPGSGITISQVLAQAYSDASGVSTFPYKVTLQSLSGDDQTPVYDTGITTSTTVTNTINNVRPVSTTASTQYSNQVITDFKTRMGYYLGITVDTGLTGNFALLKAMIESQTINLYEIPVSGSNGNYMLYLGGTSLDWNQATIYLKFIDTTAPPTLTVTPSSTIVTASSTATTFNVSWSNIAGGSVNLTVSAETSGSPSFSSSTTQTTKTLSGTNGSQSVTVYYSTNSGSNPTRVYVATATAGSLSANIRITHNSTATLVYHKNSLKLKSADQHNYYVTSLTIETYDGSRSNTFVWPVNQQITSTEYTVPTSSCTATHTDATISERNIELDMTGITFVTTSNGSRPGAVCLTLSGMKSQGGTRPTNSYWLEEDPQHPYTFIIPSSIGHEDVGGVSLGNQDTFPENPEITIYYNNPRA